MKSAVHWVNGLKAVNEAGMKWRWGGYFLLEEVHVVVELQQTEQFFKGFYNKGLLLAVS